MRKAAVDWIRRTYRGERRPCVVKAANTSFPVMRHERSEHFLWLDRKGCGADVARQLRQGSVSEGEAAELREWSEQGYVVLRGCVPHDVIDRALDDLDRAWRDRKPISIDVLTDGRRTTLAEVEPEARSQPYKLNDFYLFSPHVREIFLNRRLIKFLDRVFQLPVVGINSLTFERGSQQPAHVDHIYMTPPVPRRLAASWIALEDIRPESGPLELWAGSHRLQPFDFGAGRYNFTPEQQENHTAYMAEQKSRFPHHTFMAQKGDVLLWHAMLIHGGSPIQNPAATRKSMACHYFSRECFPGPAADGLRSAGHADYLPKGIEDPD